MISIDPVRARDDPVVVKNIPYYKAKKVLETEVMKLDPPPRPHNWGVSLNCLHLFLKKQSELSPLLAHFIVIFTGLTSLLEKKKEMEIGRG